MILEFAHLRLTIFGYSNILSSKCCKLREGNCIQSCLKVLYSDNGSDGVESSVTSNREALIAKINRKDWWHVTPADPRAYDKRGKFYASTFREGEFWGRPLDT